ncbi:class I SAM-dependent methyltransferase [Shewanella sp. Scap07]|uniref:class I SAM-dependent methyltransferase n=1 Tax=Shewanella sp. Scap07 TaxID=2589987 RepID=UPI0015B7AFAD|nr:class I SAM-dependent methyltransferase [Shewanella sp. Scap07]QLE83807.1 class I SAM-dependent methyltransferase [Shewanella sp. Scap07]
MDYLALNKAAWDARTKTHVGSKFYDVAGFLEGKSSLNEIELSALDVKGKSLLHLQCHFGLDTLSWAREGAKVTGVDLSSVAIEQAQQLATKTDIDAEFVCCDLYSAAATLQRQFDVVFTSYGAICWLPDLDKWAEVIASSLKAGGQFYMVEFHPVEAMLEGYSYFAQEQADVEQEGTYTENASDEKHTMVTWPHSLANVISALLKAGLCLQQFSEFDYSPYNCFADMIAGGQLGESDERYYILHQQQRIPLCFSIAATKPA